MTMTAINLASLLCSRLCHDLLSPVSAMNNGIELLADEHDPEMRARCIDLLSESAKVSASKLKFFRLAFGQGGGFSEAVDTEEIREAIAGLFGFDHRIQLGWMMNEPVMEKEAVRILLNLSLIASDALVRGGNLDIGAEGHEMVIRAEGRRLVFDEQIEATLLGKTPQEQLTPRLIAAWLIHTLIKERGGDLQIVRPEPNVLLFGINMM
ncbi:MAG: histidine phosphotransferase family protein [Zymomonas mobilis]